MSFSRDQTLDRARRLDGDLRGGGKELCLPGPRLTLGTRLTQVGTLRDKVSERTFSWQPSLTSISSAA